MKKHPSLDSIINLVFGTMFGTFIPDLYNKIVDRKANLHTSSLWLTIATFLAIVFYYTQLSPNCSIGNKTAKAETQERMYSVIGDTHEEMLSNSKTPEEVKAAMDSYAYAMNTCSSIDDLRRPKE